jgi:hypothetical protein
MGSEWKRQTNYKSPRDRMSHHLGFSPSNTGFGDIKGKNKKFLTIFLGLLKKARKDPVEPRGYWV